MTTPSSPKASASGSQVLAFYNSHHSTERTGILVAMFAFACFVAFTTTLSTYLHRDGAGALGALMVAAAVIFAVGFTVNAGFAFALADVRTHLALASAQTLNVLDEDVFFAIAGGIALFGIAAGLSILRGPGLPRWLGWCALAIGIAAFTPLFGLALIALSPWTLVASTLVYRRRAHASPRRSPRGLLGSA